MARKMTMKYVVYTKPQKEYEVAIPVSSHLTMKEAEDHRVILINEIKESSGRDTDFTIKYTKAV